MGDLVKRLRDVEGHAVTVSAVDALRNEAADALADALEQVRLTKVYWENEAKSAFGAGIHHGKNLDDKSEIWTKEAYEEWRKDRMENYS